MKKTEHAVTGGDSVSDGVEMAGWGVEEADARHKKDASTYLMQLYSFTVHFYPNVYFLGKLLISWD